MILRPIPVAVVTPDVAAGAGVDRSAGGSTSAGSDSTSASLTSGGQTGGSEDAGKSGPVYTRWWFWTIVGAVVVGGGATAYFLTRSKGQECPAGLDGCW